MVRLGPSAQAQNTQKPDQAHATEAHHTGQKRRGKQARRVQRVLIAQNLKAEAGRTIDRADEEVGEERADR